MALAYFSNWTNLYNCTIGPRLIRWKAEHEVETAAVGASLPVELLEAVHERV